MVASDSKKPRLDPHHPLGESEFKSLYAKSISEYNHKQRAGVVQWQYRSFPSFGRGFDSHRPLQILKDLRSRAGFHGFQNINFVAKLHGKFSANLFEGDFTGVKSRHRSGGMTHLLTNNGGVYSCKFPSPVAASSKGVHSSLLKS